MPLHSRTAASTRMPNGQNFETVLPHTVVHPVAYAVDVKAPHVRGLGLSDLGTDVRLLQQQVGDVLQFLANCSWRRTPVRRPPLDNAFYFAGGASRDV